jgi:hypothetical protein
MRNIVISLFASAVATMMGCVDATPSDFTVPDAGAGGGRADVDYGDLPPDAIPDPNALCRACLEAPEDPGPGCAGPHAACMADEKCASIYECAFMKDCWSIGEQGPIIICTLPCYQAVGITSPMDPVVALTSPILGCVLGPCAPVCKAMVP